MPILLWLVGVPLSVIILLMLFGFLSAHGHVVISQ
jgi:hypothetical protein